MSKTIISTVGTSLLGNAKRKFVGIEASDAQMLEYIKENPTEASAEVNALSRLLEAGDKAILLHSDTVDGKRCAELVRQYLEYQKYGVTLECIEGLNYKEKGFVQYGLRKFVQLLAKYIRDSRRAGQEVMINATGGFKAEIAYATAVGLVFKVPVCYIHEKFNDIVTLPAAPLAWDTSLFVGYADFFEWIDQEPRSSQEVAQRLYGLPEEVRMLLEEDGEHTLLSPLGEAFLEAFKGELEQAQSVPLLLSRKAMRDWQNFDSHTRSRFIRLLKRLRMPQRMAQAELKSGGGNALGFPKGHVAERLFFSEYEQQLYVFELSPNHDRSYEELCSKGLRWIDYPKEEFTLLEL